MIEYFLFLCIFGVLTYSNFVHTHSSTTMMVAYVGVDHPRIFERQYIHMDADLFVFKNKRYHSIHMQYKKKGTEQHFFTESKYNQMLVVHLLHFNVPLIDENRATSYIHNNKTVAEYFTKKSKKQRIIMFI